MKRLDFFKSLALSTAGFAILPAATTYGRIWKPTQTIIQSPEYIINPEWVNAPFELYILISGDFTKNLLTKSSRVFDTNLVRFKMMRDGKTLERVPAFIQAT